MRSTYGTDLREEVQVQETEGGRGKEESRGEQSVRVDPSICRPVSASLSALADRVNGQCETDSCVCARACVSLCFLKKLSECGREKGEDGN